VRGLQTDPLGIFEDVKTLLYLLLASTPTEAGRDALIIQFARREADHEPIHVGEWVELGIDYPSHRLASFVQLDPAGDAQEVDLGTMYENEVVQIDAETLSSKLLAAGWQEVRRETSPMP
jgi:hypothetical protein